MTVADDRKTRLEFSKCESISGSFHGNFKFVRRSSGCFSTKAALNLFTCVLTCILQHGLRGCRSTEWQAAGNFGRAISVAEVCPARFELNPG